jgi:hypothetical protein
MCPGTRWSGRDLRLCVQKHNFSVTRWILSLVLACHYHSLVTGYQCALLQDRTGQANKRAVRALSLLIRGVSSLSVLTPAGKSSRFSISLSLVVTRLQPRALILFCSRSWIEYLLFLSWSLPLCPPVTCPQSTAHGASCIQYLAFPVTCGGCADSVQLTATEPGRPNSRGPQSLILPSYI